MKRSITLILDLDGVLITTPPWKSDQIHADGYSEFDISCVENLNKLLLQTKFDIWLSSTRRTVKTITEFNLIFKNRKIRNKIIGFLPQYSTSRSRKEEIEQFITDKNVLNYLIIDDDKSLNGLDKKMKKYLVLTELTKGFNSEKLQEAKKILIESENI